MRPIQLDLGVAAIVIKNSEILLVQETGSVPAIGYSQGYIVLVNYLQGCPKRTHEEYLNCWHSYWDL